MFPFLPNANCRLELDVPAYGDAHDMKIARDPKSDGSMANCNSGTGHPGR